MTSSLRLAVLSAWHVHAKDYGYAARIHPGTELAAVWDEDPDRGQELAGKLETEFAPDLDELLARKDIDGVTVTAATSDHDALISRAIAAGKHIYSEKLLSPTVAGCDALIQQSQEAGVVLTVSLPRLSHGYTLALREILDSGRLGRITYSRVRLAHNGSVADALPHRFYNPVEAIGGAFTDLGAHPVYLTQMILGEEFTSITPTYTEMTGRGVEDNVSVTVTTADGAIGVIETGFVTPGSPFTIEVHGTEASVIYGFGAPQMLTATRAKEEWTEVAIPEDAPSPFCQWVQAIRDGDQTLENLRRARSLTALVAAANDAARSRDTL